MSTLEKIQQQFYQALIAPQLDPLDFIHSNYPQERFDVYRNTILENLRNSLALTYAGIWKLLGDDCADSVAYVFTRDPQYFPKTGCLEDWGAEFPQFLASLTELAHLPYLKDYAMYEWIMHLAYRAENGVPITLQSLENLSEEKISNLRFVFLPSVFIFTAQFAVYQIQEIIEQPDASTIDLQPSITTAVIARPERQVFAAFVSSEVGAFFQSLQTGATLNDAATQICEICPDFDLTTAIHLLFKHRLIQEIL